MPNMQLFANINLQHNAKSHFNIYELNCIINTVPLSLGLPILANTYTYLGHAAPVSPSHNVIIQHLWLSFIYCADTHI